MDPFVCPVHKRPLVPGLGPPAGEPGVTYHADFLIGRKQHFPFDRVPAPGRPAGTVAVEFCPACRAARQHWRNTWGAWWEVYGKPRGDRPATRCLVHNRPLVPVPATEGRGPPSGPDEMAHFASFMAVERARFPHAGPSKAAATHCPACRAARARWAAAAGTWADKERLMLRGEGPTPPAPPLPPAPPWWAFWRSPGRA